MASLPKNIFRFNRVALSPFHQESQHLCKSKKYWDVAERVAKLGFSISNVFSRDYQERYTLTRGETIIEIEGFHNGARIFESGFHVNTPCDDVLRKELEDIFNSPFEFSFELNYLPDTEVSQNLFSLMREYCQELDIDIISVEDVKKQNYIIYYMRTDAFCSCIQFYYNKEGQLTSALPRAYKCQRDYKLNSLLQKLNSHAHS